MTYQGRAQRRSRLSRSSVTERMDCRGAQRRRVYTRSSPQLAPARPSSRSYPARDGSPRARRSPR